MHQNVKKKMHFMLQVMIQLTVQSKGAPDDATLGGAPKDTLSHLHKNTQDGSFEVARKGTLEVALELHLCLHLFMLKCVQNGSYNGGSDAALGGALDGGLNVGLEWGP